MDGKMLDRSENTDEACLDTSCSICLEILMINGERSIANLCCGHKFHLDCIGSAFNAKGAMQCPNCRRVEEGSWLFAKRNHASAADRDIENWVVDITFSNLGTGFWYERVRRYSLSDEEYAPHQNVSRSLSSRSNLVSEAYSVTTPSESQIRNWQQHPSHSPLRNTTNRSSSGLNLRLSRSDIIRQQRYLSYVHSNPLLRRLANFNTSINGDSSTFSTLSTNEGRRNQTDGGTLSNINVFYEPLVPYSIFRDAPNIRLEPRRSARNAAPYYGGNNDMSPLPWIPHEGDARWWGPFNPGSTLQTVEEGQGSDSRSDVGQQPPH